MIPLTDQGFAVREASRIAREYFGGQDRDWAHSGCVISRRAAALKRYTRRSEGVHRGVGRERAVDGRYTIRITMRFEWDLEKELINIKKHGIDFTLASKVFDDPNFALIKDRIDNETGEQRWHAIGVASVDEAALLVVAHIYRGQNEEETIRIISAREASKRERRLYIQ
jgi:uncharacterized DUF497 family protein